MIIKSVDAKSILDSRKEKTIFISIKTDVGNFSASAPTGKSTGKYEIKTYKKSLDGDIAAIKSFKDYFSNENIENFDDLRRIEDIVDRHVGGNTLFALESAALKALAKEKFKTSQSSSKNVERKNQEKDIWRLINSDAKILPRLVGNCIGGGKHSETDGKKPDFQEFLLIPKSNSAIKSFERNKEAKKNAEIVLKKNDENFKGKKNDENAWVTSLDDKSTLEILKELKNSKEKIGLDCGVDIAASGFYKRKKYTYENPLFKREIEEQLSYVSNLVKNFDILYVEDPFDEEDFEGFAKLLKKFPSSMIVGDDLTVTNCKRLKKAIDMKSINAIIVKPNQCGSLLEVKRVCEMAKENNIKIIFSHRSGETEETILADLAFGFGADFFKCGIEGDSREKKIKRLIEIEKSL